MFSLVAFFLLSLLGSYISSDSPWIVMDETIRPGTKADLDTRAGKALHVFLAAGMYAGTAGLSFFLWTFPGSCSTLKLR